MFQEANSVGRLTQQGTYVHRATDLIAICLR